MKFCLLFLFTALFVSLSKCSEYSGKPPEPRPIYEKPGSETEKRGLRSSPPGYYGSERSPGPGRIPMSHYGDRGHTPMKTYGKEKSHPYDKEYRIHDSGDRGFEGVGGVRRPSLASGDFGGHSYEEGNDVHNDGFLLHSSLIGNRDFSEGSLGSSTGSGAGTGFRGNKPRPIPNLGFTLDNQGFQGLGHHDVDIDVGYGDFDQTSGFGGSGGIALGHGISLYALPNYGLGLLVPFKHGYGPSKYRFLPLFGQGSLFWFLLGSRSLHGRNGLGASNAALNALRVLGVVPNGPGGDFNNGINFVDTFKRNNLFDIYSYAASSPNAVVLKPEECPKLSQTCPVCTSNFTLDLVSSMCSNKAIFQGVTKRTPSESDQDALCGYVEVHGSYTKSSMVPDTVSYSIGASCYCPSALSEGSNIIVFVPHFLDPIEGLSLSSIHQIVSFGPENEDYLKKILSSCA